MPAKIFVAKLPTDTTETGLRDFFSAAGFVTSVVLPIDRQTGKKRGFAFVEFKDKAGADEAIRRFNDQAFNGRTIVVTEARPRQESGSRNRPSWSRSESPLPGPKPAGGGDRRRDESAAGFYEVPAESRRPQRSRSGKAGSGKKGTAKEPRAPRGPIPERRSDRFFDLGDAGDESEIADFDNIATSAIEEDEVHKN